jgi:hypothetical protein
MQPLTLWYAGQESAYRSRSRSIASHWSAGALRW